MLHVSPGINQYRGHLNLTLINAAAPIQYSHLRRNRLKEKLFKLLRISYTVKTVNRSTHKIEGLTHNQSIVHLI